MGGQPDAMRMLLLRDLTEVCEQSRVSKGEYGVRVGLVAGSGRPWMVCSTGGRASVEGSQLSVVGGYRQKGLMRQKDCSGGRRVSGGDVVVVWCGGRSVNGRW